MLDLKLQDRIPCSGIRKRTKIIDVIEYTLKQKCKWAGHIARMKDNRTLTHCRSNCYFTHRILTTGKPDKAVVQWR